MKTDSSWEWIEQSVEVEKMKIINMNNSLEGEYWLWMEKKAKHGINGNATVHSDLII